MDEREMFEAFWKREMNVDEMDLHRCGYPMMPAHKQPYACHETNRAWMTWQAARRITPDREAVIAAAQRLVRDALDDVRVHPCDEHNDEMRSNGLSELMYGLYAALQTTATTPPRDTLIEEIAEMVDHMGEGRRLEEYVGAIREMKSGDKGGA